MKKYKMIKMITVFITVIALAAACRNPVYAGTAYTGSPDVYYTAYSILSPARTPGDETNP